MKCRYCERDMHLDDVDFNFKGNKDNYWACDNCKSGCIEQIRYNRSVKEFWHKESGSEVIDETVNKWNKM